MASPSPATKKITAITKPTKPPTTFLSLARELRQRILSETYQDDDEAPWRVALGNQQWSATLNAIHPALFSDVDYVNSKWVEDMIALAEDKWSAKHPSGLTTMRDEDRAAVWTAYWGDTAPWSRVGRTLFLKNHKWWYAGGGCGDWHEAMRQFDRDPRDREVLGRIADIESFSLWDHHGRIRDIHRHMYHQPVPHWPGGASGVEWDKTGCHHPPSSWDGARDVNGSPISLQDAAAQDIAWLHRQQ
ncbi:putative glutaminase [Venturia nashicola]|nr:putative glutaminase [Venturia nashicola]